MVFFVGGSTVRALDLLSGTQLWSAASGGGTHWQSVIVANRMVFVADQAGHLSGFGLSTGPAAPAVLGVLSRKTHGAAGIFDLNLSPGATRPHTDPRVGPAQ